MSKSLLLDTSAVIPHLRRHEAVTNLFNSADHLYLPIVALGELFHGAYRLPFPKKQLEKIQTLQRAVIVLGARNGNRRSIRTNHRAPSRCGTEHSHERRLDCRPGA